MASALCQISGQISRTTSLTSYQIPATPSSSKDLLLREQTSGSNRFKSLYKLCFLLAMWFREGNGTRLQYSCLENPMDGGAWKAVVHGVTEGWSRLSDFIFTFYFHALEKEMAPHSSVLAWRIPGTGEPGGLPSMVSHRVGHNWSDLVAAAAAAVH